MKIIKNKYLQVATMILLIVGVAFAINHFTKPVMASDELTREEFNKKMEEINIDFSEIKKVIEAQQIQINDLKNENKELKTILKNTDSKFAEINTDINKFNKWYNYSKETYSPLGSSGYYGNQDYIKSKFIEFFEQN